MDYLRGHNFKVKIDNEYFDAEKTFTINRSADVGVHIKKTGNENFVKKITWSLDVQLYMSRYNHDRLIRNKNIVDVILTDEGVPFFVLPFTLPFVMVEKKVYNDIKIRGKAIITSVKENFSANDFALVDVSFTGVSESLINEKRIFDGDENGFILPTTFPVIFVEKEKPPIEEGFPYTFPFKLS
jgi:hypothetical protein